MTKWVTFKDKRLRDIEAKVLERWGFIAKKAFTASMGSRRYHIFAIKV